MKNKLIAFVHESNRPSWFIDSMPSGYTYNVPKIEAQTLSLGPFSVQVGSYTVAGGGKTPEQNEDYQFFGVIDVKGRPVLVAIANDGLTGVSGKDILVSDRSGGRFASRFIADYILANMREDITEDSLRRLVGEANRALGEINWNMGLMNSSQKAATMLVMFVMTEAGEAYLVQLGDAQYQYHSEDKHEIKQGDQEVLGRLQLWVRDHASPERLMDYCSRQFDLLINKGGQLDLAQVKALLDDYSVPQEYRPENLELLAFAALNGDPAAEQFVHISKVNIHPGDEITLYTDGIIDGLDNEAVLRRLLNSGEPGTALLSLNATIVQNLLSGHHHGFKPFGDDQAIVVIRTTTPK